MIPATENFIAPEALFNARKPHPAAMDTFSLGCTFFALLRMRTVLRGGGRMPPNGTHAHLFRTQRVALIGDLQQRKPALFVDKDLDPAQFPSPEKLPEKDRRLVAEAMEGVFGKPNERLEGVLATETLHLLDRALRVDPALRFRDPLEMAGEFEALAQRFRELALRADGGVGSGRMVVSGGGGAPSGGVGGGSGPRAAISVATGPEAPPPSADACSTGASAPRILVSEDIVVEEASGRRGTGAAAPGAARVPSWIGVALLAVLVLQVIQLAVAGTAVVLLLNAPAAPVPAAAVAPMPAAPMPTAAPADPGPTIAPAPTLAALVEAAPVAPAPEVTTPPAAAPPTGTAAVSAPAKAAPVAASTSADVVPKRVGTPPPAAGTVAQGLILVSGGQAYLLGPEGRMSVGGVNPGTYELFAQTRPGGEPESQGSVVIKSGDRIVYKCGLGTCRRLP